MCGLCAGDHQLVNAEEEKLLSLQFLSALACNRPASFQWQAILELQPRASGQQLPTSIPVFPGGKEMLLQAAGEALAYICQLVISTSPGTVPYILTFTLQEVKTKALQNATSLMPAKR